MSPAAATALSGLMGTLAGGAFATLCMVRARYGGLRARSRAPAHYAFTTVADSARAKLWLSDAQGRTTFINQRLCEFLGLAPPVVAGDAWREAIHVEDRARFDQLLHSTLVHRESVDAEVRLRNAAGAYRWMRARLAPLAYPADASSGIVGLLMDVTAEYEARRALERTHAFERSVVSRLAYGLIAVNPEGRIVLFNPGAEQLLGYTAAEAQSLESTDVLCMPGCSGDLSPPNPVDRECNLRHRSGREVPVAISLAPMQSDSGELIAWLAVLKDLSRRRQTERALVESELKFRTLYEAAPIAIVLNRLDDGRFLDANPGFYLMTGYEPGDLARLGAADLLAPVRSDETTRMLGDLRHRGAFGPIERECLRKDGSRLHVLINGVRIRPQGGVPAVWSVAQDITERKKAEGELRRAAHFDRLTGLGNRELLAQRLERCIRLAARFADHHFALLYLDMDRFKNINDSLGHAAGDEMLQEVAVRLRSILRGTDDIAPDRRTLASRFGGDEFVVLLNGLKHPGDAERVANRVLRELGKPYRLLDREFRSSASIGIVTSDSRHRSAEEYLRDADMAMYEAKLAGRGRVALFDECMSARVHRRVLLENELANAQACDQLFLVYQPQMSLATGELYGCEALLRWTHPELGLVSPAEFIPIAEENGLILELGDWVLLEACRQFSVWRAEYGENAVPRIGINLSRAQLMLEDIDQRVAGVLEAFGIEPSCVHLEITETAVMRDADTALGIMNRLRALGVRLDLDDFGTGYSSLSCLSEFPLDTIKMDRTFLHRRHAGDDPGALIEAATSLARRLGLRVIAEGIETPEELALLRPLGCHVGQGYLFAQPMLPEAFAEFIAHGRVLEPDPGCGLAATGTDRK